MKRQRKKQNIHIGLLVLSFILLMSACSGAPGATSSAPMAAMDTAAYENAMPQEAPAGEIAAYDGDAEFGSGSEGGDMLYGMPDAGRKLIREGSLEVETLYYDESLDSLSKLIEETGGYVESSEGSGNGARTESRYAYFVIRVPSAQFSAFMRRGGEIGNVLRESSSSEDITDAFYDTEARLASLQIMEERLLALLSKSTELKDIISLEQSLSETRYEIERLTGTLRKWEGLVAYSKVTVSLHEVEEYIEPVPAKPKTLGERISTQFITNWDGVREFFASAAVLIIGGIPVLLPLALFLGIILAIVLFAAKRTETKRKQPSANPDDPQ